MDRLCLFAEIYKRASMIKEAGLLENMAARILYSTQDPMRQYLSGDNTVELEALIPGAKELAIYGAMAVVDEMKHYEKWFGDDERFAEAHAAPEGKEFLSLRPKNLKDFSPEKIIRLLDEARTAFADADGWDVDFGGSSWANIAAVLSNLTRAIQKVDALKTNNRHSPEYIQALKEMVAYMNAVDGLVHNTGSLFDKMIRLENPNKHWSELTKDEKQLQRLLDAKELSDPRAVAAIALPYVQNTPELAMPFRDLMSEHYRTRHQSFETPIDTQLHRARLNKQLTLIESSLNQTRSLLDQGNAHDASYHMYRICADLYDDVMKYLGKTKQEILPYINKVQQIQDVVFATSDNERKEQAINVLRQLMDLIQQKIGQLYAEIAEAEPETDTDNSLPLWLTRRRKPLAA